MSNYLLLEIGLNSRITWTYFRNEPPFLRFCLLFFANFDRSEILTGGCFITRVKGRNLVMCNAYQTQLNIKNVNLDACTSIN